MKKVCALLVMVFFACIAAIISIYETKPAEYELLRVYDGFNSKDFYSELPKHFERPKPEPNPIFEYYEREFVSRFNEIQIPVRELKLESLGWYYITAYCSCSKCCWPSTNITASGVECHYSDYEPTTCAIDRNIHDFGDLFYIDGKLYVAEDTGSAVKGKHIDLYFPDHSDVENYGSHYEEVYTVEYEYHLEPANNYNIQKYIHKGG